MTKNLTFFERPINYFRDTDNRVLLVLLFFAIAIRFITYRMFLAGGDSINYWFAAKTLYYGLPYARLDHQTTRFGVIIPIFLFAKIFGLHPFNSTFLPVLMSIIQAGLIYKIGVKVHSRSVGFTAAVLFMLFPRVLASGGQILPSTISITYLLLSFALIITLDENDRWKYIKLVVSSLIFFCAYESKIINLYFLPGFFYTIYRVTGKFKDIVIYGGILFGLYLTETLLYYMVTGNPLGRIGIIRGTHLTQKKLVPVHFLHLFKRYTELPLYSRVQFYYYILSSILISRFIKHRFITSLVITAGIFFILMLFSVKSINPIIPAMPYNEVYLGFGIPFMMLIISIFTIELIKFLISKYSGSTPHPKAEKGIKGYVIFTVALISLIVILRSSGALPKNVSDKFVNDIFYLKEHKISLFFRYYNELNKAYNSGIPILSGYKYRVETRRLFDDIQELLKKGKDLREACQEKGITLKEYHFIRPRMPKKSLKLTRKVFLDVHPEILGEAIISKTVYKGYIINYLIKQEFQKNSLEIKKSFDNNDMLFLVTTRNSIKHPFSVRKMNFSDYLKFLER